MVNLYRIDPASMRYAYVGMRITHGKKEDAVKAFSDGLTTDKVAFTTENKGDEVWFYPVPKDEPFIGKVVPIKA